MISETDFRAVVAKRLKTFQGLHIVMAIGMTVLSGTAFVLTTSGAKQFPVLPAPLEMIRWVTYVHLFVATGCYMLHAFMPAMVMAAKPARNAGELYSQMVLVRMVQLTLLIGPAVVALMGCLLGVRNGALAGSPLYWLNLVTVVVFYVRWIRIFPTEEKLVAFHRERARV